MSAKWKGGVYLHRDKTPRKKKKLPIIRSWFSPIDFSWEDDDDDDDCRTNLQYSFSVFISATFSIPVIFKG